MADIISTILPHPFQVVFSLLQGFMLPQNPHDCPEESNDAGEYAVHEDDLRALKTAPSNQLNESVDRTDEFIFLFGKTLRPVKVRVSRRVEQSSGPKS
ncbi:MAG: hypothetical protein KKD44_17015 [Proteobacteria bacterium]|nr:hypothetical protein [Pseudomonadota bacterium]